MSPQNRHLLLAVGGLLLVGAGLSLTGHAILLKAAASPGGWLVWSSWGTGGLALVNAGICCVVEAAFAKRST